jgi:hypothetical protein
MGELVYEQLRLQCGAELIGLGVMQWMRWIAAAAVVGGGFL